MATDFLFYYIIRMLNFVKNKSKANIEWYRTYNFAPNIKLDRPKKGKIRFGKKL